MYVLSKADLACALRVTSDDYRWEAPLLEQALADVSNLPLTPDQLGALATARNALATVHLALDAMDAASLALASRLVKES